MNEIITFFGTDGSGKTTLARKLGEAYSPAPTTIIGGSSYKEWLTPQVARDVLGPQHGLDTLSSSPEDLTRLYEDIAIACYGLAHIIKSRGEGVIIDSDPFLKRLIWGTLDKNEQEGTDYVRSFTSRVSDVLHEEVRPDVAVAVNMNDERLSPEDILARIGDRDNNSEHDPTTIEAMTSLESKAVEIWRHIEASTYAEGTLPGLNARLAGMRLVHVKNPPTSPENLSAHTTSIVTEIKSGLEQ